MADEGEKTFEVEPQSSLFDEDVYVIVAGLGRGERVLVTAAMKDNNGVTWTSQAEFVASGFGVVHGQGHLGRYQAESLLDALDIREGAGRQRGV